MISTSSTPTKHRILATAKRYINGFKHRWRLATTYRLVRWYGLGEHQQAWYLKRLLPLLQVDLLIDVGGNAGQFAHFVRQRLGYRGRMITFEPIPELAEQLRAKARSDQNWIIVNAALGESQRSDTFHITKSSPMSSLLKPSTATTDKLSKFGEIKTSIEVQVETLDHYLASNPDLAQCRNIYLKLDVQGFEKKVLQGAQQSLPKIGALQAELSVIPIYEGQPDYKEMTQYIEECGYMLSFIPAHDYQQFPEMIDFDCHFIRRDRLEQLGALRQSRNL